MKLWLALLNVGLDYRFQLGEITVSKILKKHVPILCTELKCFLAWTSRLDCQRSMRMLVRQMYQHYRCITDCSEIHITVFTIFYCSIQDLLSLQECRNILKFFIGITPCEAILLTSKCWGGKATDKKIILDSGFTLKLEGGGCCASWQVFL